MALGYRLRAKKGNEMSQTIDRTTLDFLFEDDSKVCVFCDELTTLPYCVGCQEYKGLMSIAEWEAYTGETWESE